MGRAGGRIDWPDAEHNIFVDHNDNVWISGTSPSGQSVTRDSDDMLLKFTKQGKFVKQFGGRSMNLGSKDPTSVNKPGDLFVYAKTNEVFVADGYGNRRLIVYDATTLAYKRMWGRSAIRLKMSPGTQAGAATPAVRLRSCRPIGRQRPRTAQSPRPRPLSFSIRQARGGSSSESLCTASRCRTTTWCMSAIGKPPLPGVHAEGHVSAPAVR